MPTIKQYQRMREAEFEFPQTRREDDPMYVSPKNTTPVENKDLTQIIIDKAKECAEGYVIHPGHEIKEILAISFTAGAQYGLSLQKDLLIGFAIWVTRTALYKNSAGKWCYWNSYMVFAENDDQLWEKYLDHLNPIKKDCQD